MFVSGGAPGLSDKVEGNAGTQLHWAEQTESNLEL